MDCRVTSTRKTQRGESLPATVIGMGLASLLFAAIASVYLYSARSFVDLGNYMQMDGNARHALDLMSSDIRQADGIASYSSNALTLKFGTNLLSYTLDTAQRTLFRDYLSVRRKLLTDCDGVNYDVFQRNPTNGVYDYFPDSSSATNSKLVEVTVLCTRSVLGHKANSTTLQSAKTVIRKQK
jgi:Tfp pilus assembly protein PilW